ncbi:hypothetical protein SCA6_016884 [Theobroma cacao]
MSCKTNSGILVIMTANNKMVHVWYGCLPRPLLLVYKNDSHNLPKLSKIPLLIAVSYFFIASSTSVCFLRKKKERKEKKGGETVAHLKLALFVLNDNQHLTYSQVWFNALMPSLARYLREHVMSKHDVCEDG